MFSNLDEKELIDVLNTCEELNINVSKLINDKFNFNEDIVLYLIEFYTKKFVSVIKRYELNGKTNLNQLEKLFISTYSIPNNTCELDFFFNKLIRDNHLLKNKIIFKRETGLNPIRNFLRYYKFIFFLKLGYFSNRHIHSFTDIDKNFVKYLKIKKNLTEFRCFEWIPFRCNISSEHIQLKSIKTKFCSDPIINDFANKFYFKFLPISIMQSLKFSRKIEKVKFRSLNSCSQLYNDFFNVILFTHASKNLVCRVGQHGIDYGLKKNLKHFNKTKEEKNKFIEFHSWWTKKPSSGEIINGKYFGRSFSTEKNIGNKILFIMPLPPLDYLLDDLALYEKFKNNFISLSKNAGKFKIYIKLHNNFNDYDDDQKFLNTIRENGVIIIENLTINNQLLSEFNTVIYGYLSTGFFESLLSGIKTKCIDIYGESRAWKSNNLTDELRNQKLIFNILPSDINLLLTNLKLNVIDNILLKYIRLN